MDRRKLLKNLGLGVAGVAFGCCMGGVALLFQKEEEGFPAEGYPKNRKWNKRAGETTLRELLIGKEHTTLLLDHNNYLEVFIDKGNNRDANRYMLILTNTGLTTPAIGRSRKTAELPSEVREYLEKEHSGLEEVWVSSEREITDENRIMVSSLSVRYDLEVRMGYEDQK
jgi:hypothetical protein